MQTKMLVLLRSLIILTQIFFSLSLPLGKIMTVMKQSEMAFSPISNDDFVKWQKVVADILAEAKTQGATAAEVSAGYSSGFNATVRMGDVETVTYNNDKNVGVTIYLGQQQGSATTSDISPAAIKSTVAAACSIARLTGSDSFAGLADKDLLAENYPELDLYHPWPISVEEGIDLALKCENYARSLDKRITNSEGATCSTHQGLHVYGNSDGFLGSYSSSRHSLSCSLIAQAGNQMKSDYSFTVARAVEDLLSDKWVAEQVVQRAVGQLGAQRLSTREAPVIFAADLAGGLIGHFIAAIRGSSLYRKSSFLLDHLGKKVFPEYIHIYQQPHLLKGLGSAPFDAEGVRTQQLDYIHQGILQNYVLSSYSARKLGMKTTGNAGGVFNLFVDATAGDLADLLKKMDKGLLVTHLMGQGVNIVTGDYSRGATGFWVENGQIQFPVEEITIAGNLREMFLHLLAVGNDVERRGNIQTGSLLIEKMIIAGE